MLLSTVGYYRRKSTRYVASPVGVTSTMTSPQRPKNITTNTPTTTPTVGKHPSIHQASKTQQTVPKTKNTPSITNFFKPTATPTRNRLPDSTEAQRNNATTHQATQNTIDISPARPLTQRTTMTSTQQDRTQSRNKDHDDDSTATVVATNTTTTNNTPGTTKPTAAKLAFNPWRTVHNNRTTTTGIPINQTPLPKDFPFTTRCRLRWWHVGDKKSSKTNYRSFLTDFLTFIASLDGTITIFKFFSTDRTPPRFPTSPLQAPFQLPMDLSNLRYYFPGRTPEPPSNVAVMLYIGHTVEFADLTARAETWLQAKNASWTATTIQSEHAKDLCWFVYSTKNTNCKDLGAALSTLLGKTVGLQFKTIQTGPPQKPTASAVHLLADEADSAQIMHQLNDIYSEDRMNNRAADYPLGQRLLLAPIAQGLNDNNLTALMQLKAKQASFCTQIIMVTTRTVRDLDAKATFQTNDGNHSWSLRELLMQVAHPTNENCAFFQAIDNYSSGQGVVFTMLPSAATFGRNAVLGLLPFTRWLLEPVYGKRQSYHLDLAFHPEAIQDMAAATWDERQNCVQQQQGDLLGCALKDLEIYDLRTPTVAQPPATVLVDTTGTALQETKGTNGQAKIYQTSTSGANHAQIQLQDNDSLTNSIHSQNTMFTQAIQQMDSLAERQAHFETNTQMALETIMNQLAELTRHNRKRQYHRDQSDEHQAREQDDPQTRAAADDSMEEDVSETE